MYKYLRHIIDWWRSWVISNHNSMELKPGVLLLAQPFFNDEIYDRSAILLIEHDSNGSRGIIVNKQSTVTIDEALPEISKAHNPVYFGGPIDSRSITYVHSLPQVPDCHELEDGLFIGGAPDELEHMIDEGEVDLEQIKFLAGIVEWDAGQLEEELKDKKWWITKITAKEIFESPDTLWSKKLTQLGNMMGLFAHIPDPSIN